MSNKVYDVLKWISLVFLPALITFSSVVMDTLGFQYTEIVLKIAIAFNTFLGAILGISNISYKNNQLKMREELSNGKDDEDEIEVNG